MLRHSKLIDLFNTINRLRGCSLGLAVSLILTGCQTLISPPTGSAVHLKLGNPSQATTDVNNSSNFLIEKPQYVLSYNSQTGTANWVSWQLNKSWLGKVERQNNFNPDPTLPQGWYTVRPNDYRGSGYDRGHLVPSADRTKTEDDNSSTFLMTNIIPQTPELNRGAWNELEQYCRELVEQGKELYIIAGTEGKLKTFAKGKVAIPRWNWKVIVILDKPNDQITEKTRVIAVRMPNSKAVGDNWRKYQVPVDDIESKTKLDLLSNLPKEIQDQLESRLNFRS